MTDNSLPQTETAENLHIFSVEKFWHASHNLIQQKFTNILTTDQIDDQLQKLNLAYRLIQTSLETKHEEGFKSIFTQIIQDTEDLFPRLLAQNIPQETESSPYDQLKIFSDHILMCLLKQTLDHTPGLFDSRLIYECFSRSVSEQFEDFSLPQNQEAESYTPVVIPRKKKQRSIENLDQEAKDTFFSPSNNPMHRTKTSAEEKAQLNKLKLAYGLAKWKFQGVQRQSGERYFEHLREVAHIIMRQGQHPHFEQVLIAILHDIMEDTNISIHTLEKLFGKDIALSVHLISKKSCLIYAPTDKQNTDNISKLHSSSILNNNLGVCDRVKSILTHIKARQKEQGFSFNTGSDHFSDSEKTLLSDAGLKKVEIKGLEIFNFYDKNYKDTRNKDYFGHIKDRKSFTQYALKEAKMLGWYQNTEDINTQNSDNLQLIHTIVNNALQVKMADRLHNLRTLWNTGISKTKRVSEDTRKYFYALFCTEGGAIGEECMEITEGFIKKFYRLIVYSQ